MRLFDPLLRLFERIPYSLVALIAWVVFAIGFILMVAKARRDRARRRVAH